MRALQDAGISMPDAAREIIFPDGVPVRQVMGNDSATEFQPQLPAETADAAIATPGEGDLRSERGELERQADGADLTCIGENLLSPENKKDATRS